MRSLRSVISIIIVCFVLFGCGVNKERVAKKSTPTIECNLPTEDFVVWSWGTTPQGEDVRFFVKIPMSVLCDPEKRLTVEEYENWWKEYRIEERKGL